MVYILYQSKNKENDRKKVLFKTDNPPHYRKIKSDIGKLFLKHFSLEFANNSNVIQRAWNKSDWNMTNKKQW